MEGWDVRTLGDVCTIKPPKSEARTKLADADMVSFAPMEDLGIGVKYLEPHRTRRLDEVSGSYTYFAEGDVLLAKITPCFENGKLGVARSLMNGVGFGSSEYIVLRPSPRLDAEFLYYYLARPTFLEEGARQMAGAVGHKRVSKEFIETYPVPLPPLPEQRRIVAILDEAFEAIATAKANTEKNLQNARALLGRYLATVFATPGSEWETRMLGDAVRFIDYRGKTPPKREDGTRLITAKNVKMGFIQRDPEEFIDSSVYDGWMTRGFPKQGDVLFTTEAPLGNVAQLDTDEKVVIGQRLITMQPLDAALDRTFLKYALMSPPIQASIHAKGTGATVLGIKASLLKTVQIWYPSALAEQLRLAGRISAVEEEASVLSSLASRKLATLDELKKSFLHQAFTGQLSIKATDKQLAEVA